LDVSTCCNDILSRDAVDSQKAVKIDCDPFAEEYNMKHERRGVALILNHVHFDDMATRHGSVEDTWKLEASLHKLGFDVRIYTDPTIKTIATVLQSSKYCITVIWLFVALLLLVSMIDQTDR